MPSVRVVSGCGVAAGLSLATFAAAGGVRLHVRANAPAQGADGLSWATAFPDLQQALNVARFQPQSFAEIWVAEGVYRPSIPYTGPGQGDPLDPRSRAFLTAGPDVPVYGGFEGDETQLPPVTERLRRATILSGDHLGDDDVSLPPGSANSTDNSYHVVRITNGGCWFNGVTIRGGVANSASNSFDRNGGGLRSTNFNSDAVRLEHCRITYNFSQADGAGVYSNANAHIEGCVFDRNRTGAGGGAIRHIGSSLVVVNSVLRQNAAINPGSVGAGAYVTTFATFTNCTIIENASVTGGGGLHAGGGGTLRVANCVLWANSSPFFGPAAVTTSWVQGTNQDPNLLDTSGADGQHFTADDYPFGIGAVNSPLRNAGDSAADIDQSSGAIQPLPSTDARGLPRFASGGGVDIGAYQLQELGEPVYRNSIASAPFTSAGAWVGGVLPPSTSSAVFDRDVAVSFQAGEVTTRRAVATGQVDAFLGTGAIYWLPGAVRFQVFNDPFETDQGWTTQADAGLTQGQWVRVDPVGTIAQPEDDYDFAGTLCFVTGQGAPGGPSGAADVDGGVARLVSPIIDLGDAPAAELSYARWYSNSAGADPGNDVFEVEVSNDGGASWQEVETVGPDGPEASGGWIFKRLRIDHILPLTDAMRFRFSASDLGPGSLVEAAIDAFQVVRFECDPDDLLGCGAGLVVDGGGSLEISAQDSDHAIGGGTAVIGPTGDATLRVTLGASAFFPTFLVQGAAGDPAQVEIESGGSLGATLLCSIGHESGASGTLRVGDGGLLHVTALAELRVGDQGEGLVEIGSLGTMTLGDQLNDQVRACIGCEAGSAGRIILNGGVIDAETTAFRIGERGDGDMTLLSGVAAIESPRVEIGVHPGSTGSLELYEGSAFLTSGEVLVGSESGGAGAVSFMSGGVLTAASVRIAPGSAVTGQGTIDSDLFNGGRMAPANADTQSPFGVLAVSGDYQQVRDPAASALLSGRIEMDIASAPGQSDKLTLQGVATLGGGLYLSTPETFPPPGAVFALVEAAAREGAFDVVSSPVLNDRYFFRILYRDPASRGTPGPVVEVVLDALDIVAAFENEQTVELQTSGGEPLAGATADFSGDGFIDLAVVIPSLTPGNPGCVTILLNAGVDGMGEWLGFQEFASCVTVGLDPRAITAIRAGADQDIDLAVANAGSGAVTVLRNNGSGDFSIIPPLTLPAPGAPVDIASADMDLDGAEDLVVISAIVDQALIFYSNGAGGFAPAQATPIGASPTAITVNDLVAGGGPDVAISSAAAGAVIVLASDGARALNTAANVPLGDGNVPDDIDSGDVDQDKDIDIIAAATQPDGSSPGAGVVVVILADVAEPGGFRPPAPLSVGDRPRSVVLAQLDNSGGPDIAVVAEVDGDAVVQTLINTTLPGGSASFAEPTTIAASGSPRFILSADVDNDADQDLVTLNGAGALAARGPAADITTLLNELDVPLAGDVNFDGMVDFGDLNIIVSAFNTSGFGSPADLDDDGFIGFADLNIVLSNFNTR